MLEAYISNQSSPQAAGRGSQNAGKKLEQPKTHLIRWNNRNSTIIGKEQGKCTGTVRAGSTEALFGGTKEHIMLMLEET